MLSLFYTTLHDYNYAMILVTINELHDDTRTLVYSQLNNSYGINWTLFWFQPHY